MNLQAHKVMAGRMCPAGYELASPFVEDVVMFSCPQFVGNAANNKVVCGNNSLCS